MSKMLDRLEADFKTAFETIDRSIVKSIELFTQQDEHMRAYLNEIGGRGQIVIRMPDGFLSLEDYTVDERDCRWVFTDKGRPIFAGVE